ncbi:hypothetical protein ANN_17136 [Periplaneta americana]|uniref:Apple domain-containing protein n=1 Tax=Periplaneta americana TaxID=6978 RepID=A0ABQ8SS37_PERAM|nr:hypothetical protein ANN_17136 [Periplaneta americana]
MVYNFQNVFCSAECHYPWLIEGNAPGHFKLASNAHYTWTHTMGTTLRTLRILCFAMLVINCARAEDGAESTNGVPEQSAPSASGPSGPSGLGFTGPSGVEECDPDMIGFELVTGFVYSAPSDLLDSLPGTLMLTDCLEACQGNDSCQSVNYETGLCVLFSSNADSYPEEERLRVFENKVLRKIFGAKRDEVTGEWRKLHKTELHALYSSPDIIRDIKSRRLRWAGHLTCMGESRNAYRVLIWRPEEKRSLGRPRRRWEDNIKMDLREVGYDDRLWINLAQNRDRWRAYIRAAMNLWVP